MLQLTPVSGLKFRKRFDAADECLLILHGHLLNFQAVNKRSRVHDGTFFQRMLFTLQLDKVNNLKYGCIYMC